MTTQVVIALNVLRSLLNSHIFFEHISSRTDIIACLKNLMNSKNSTIAILAAHAIKASIHFNGKMTSTVDRLERLNKTRFLFAELNEHD